MRERGRKEERREGERVKRGCLYAVLASLHSCSWPTFTVLQELYQFLYHIILQHYHVLRLHIKGRKKKTHTHTFHLKKVSVPSPERQMGPRSASPQHEVEQWRGPGHGHGWRAQTRGGDGERPRRWRLRGSVGTEARQCPLKLCQSGLDDAERGQGSNGGRCSGGNTGVTCQHSPH